MLLIILLVVWYYVSVVVLTSIFPNPDIASGDPSRPSIYATIVAFFVIVIGGYGWAMLRWDEAIWRFKEWCRLAYLKRFQRKRWVRIKLKRIKRKATSEFITVRPGYGWVKSTPTLNVKLFQKAQKARLLRKEERRRNYEDD